MSSTSAVDHRNPPGDAGRLLMKAKTGWALRGDGIHIGLGGGEESPVMASPSSLGTINAVRLDDQEIRGRWKSHCQTAQANRPTPKPPRSTPNSNPIKIFHAASYTALAGIMRTLQCARIGPEPHE